MTKVAIIGGKADQSAIIEAMHSLQAVHIEQHKPGELDIGTPTEAAEDISSALVKAKSLLGYWQLEAVDAHKIPERNGRLVRSVTKIHEQVQEYDTQLRALDTEIKQKHEQLTTCNICKKLGIQAQYTTLTHVSILTGSVKQAKRVREVLDPITTQYELSAYEENGKTHIGVGIAAQHKEEAQAALQTIGFSEYPTEHIQHDPKKLTKNIQEISAKKKSIERAIQDAKKQHAIYIQEAVLRLQEEAQKAEAPLQFASSKNLFYLTGFVPSADLLIITQELEKAAKKRIHIRLLKPEKNENIPIKLDHPKPIKFFEFFMDLYSLPVYKEFDPTFFTFLTFPFLFGLMLGDIGYGLVTLVLWIILKRVMPKARGFFNILITSSIWTIFWGFLFGEFFGAEELFGHEIWHIMSRLHQINELLILSLVVGVLHVNLGLLIGFINEYRAHGLRAAILEKFSWVLVQVAAVIFYFSYAVPVFQQWTGYAVLLLAMVMLYFGEGVRGLIELPAIFSNILSYARLMAIGLASAGLALVVNQFTEEFMTKGIGGIIAAVLIFAIGHIINIALGILGPFLHSLRLHYVEFFSRFFKGGGRRFAPFGEKQ